MELKLGKFSISIRMTVVLIFILATLLTAFLAISLQYYFGRELAREATTDRFALAAAGIASKLENFNAGNTNAIRLLSENSALLGEGNEEDILAAFGEVLTGNPLLYGVYIGRPDGSLLELVNLDSKAGVRRTHLAVPGDKWLVISVEQENGEAIRRFRYYDRDFTLRTRREERTGYDVRDRLWYSKALETPTTRFSDIYLFDQLGLPGRTVSRRVRDSRVVVAIDYTLDTMSQWLGEQQVARLGEVYLFRPDGMVAASTRRARQVEQRIKAPPMTLSQRESALVAAHSPLKVSNELDWPPFDYAIGGVPQGYSVDVLRLVGDLTGLDIEFVNGYSWPELIAHFRSGSIDLLHPVMRNPATVDLGAFSKPYYSLHYAIVTPPDRPVIRDVAQLEGKSLAIPSGWSIVQLVRERFPAIEVVEVTNSLSALQAVRDGRADAAMDNEAIFRYIEQHYFLGGLQYHPEVSLGEEALPGDLHIVVGEEQRALLPLIDRAIKAITPALREQLRSRWLDYESEPEQASAGVVPHDAFIHSARSPSLHGVLTNIMYQGKRHYLFVKPASPDDDQFLFGVMVPRASVVRPYLRDVQFSIAATAGFLLLFLPLSWAFASPIVRPVKQLVVENDKVRRRDYDSVRRVGSRVKEIDELSESMVNMVQSIRAHEQAQRDLMDAFIRLIAQAIDDKSPYTGGHCERVPELALMLVEKASASDHPAFRDFRLEGGEQWREFRTAAWLHDCGKITTPEHIVDKGSKLETIYNRIHEVRMRFEVLWRDAEIRYLRACRDKPEDEARLREALERTRRQLRDDFAFVAECNVGGEHLDEASRERLREIGEQTWERHFDKHLGLSPVEEQRLPEAGEQLPVTEPLLADRPEHIIHRAHTTDYPPEYGIRMDIPEHLYNLGELYNLSISRGTLTAEDRFKINEHMISTIKMLESLPFPEELKNVPRYASTHHETMKGTGYPRRLPGSALSIPERLLAVADVFEALTAADRPYKKAKSVSEAVEILHRMVEDNHIDRDSFELFLREKVYLRYAEQYLDPAQIDSVDESRYLG